MSDWLNKTHIGDCRELLAQMAADGVRVQTCVTSPPYFGLRDYGVEGQIGLEPTPGEYVAQMVAVFRGVRDMLADDGTVWLNLGDSYWTAKGASGGVDDKQPARRGWARPQDRPAPAGLKGKDLIGIPWRVAFALQADGWYLRSDIIWHKPNPMPESVTDRPTKAHEYLFLLAKSERYYFDADAVKEPGTMKPQRRFTDGKGLKAAGYAPHRQPSGMTECETRNIRSVWSIPTAPFSGAHFATFPRELIEPCIIAGSPPGGIVLDPFMGSGTTAQVATDLGRQFIGCELNGNYAALAEQYRRTTIGMPL